MAIHFAGGTDQMYWTVPTVPQNIGCVAFKMKTTQVTANTAPLSYWNSSSRVGFGFICNNTTPNKILVVGYTTSSTQMINLESTTSINDGNWHSIAFNYNRNPGGACALFIDGVQEAAGNSAGSWVTVGSGYAICIGDNVSTFWASYIGDIAQIGHWTAQLTADEIAAIAKGFAPPRVRPANLIFHAPIIRETGELKAGFAATVTGATVSEHCRIVGPWF
ncbi:LamG-like jellyroll fold domain-containing protein [Mesorhizobium sp. M0496]|uniref:LamG-like jellyroll fold domain-containing protein n=1 Tax=Mesorhizobium sp. M0496 TaxID=2956952 RepID=UPI00333D032F